MFFNIILCDTLCFSILQLIDSFPCRIYFVGELLDRTHGTCRWTSVSTAWRFVARGLRATCCFECIPRSISSTFSIRSLTRCLSHVKLKLYINSSWPAWFLSHCRWRPLSWTPRYRSRSPTRGTLRSACARRSGRRWRTCPRVTCRCTHSRCSTRPTRWCSLSAVVSGRRSHSSSLAPHRRPHRRN